MGADVLSYLMVSDEFCDVIYSNFTYLASDVQTSKDNWFADTHESVDNKSTSVNYHFTRKCDYKCGFCFHTAKTSFVLPINDAQGGRNKIWIGGDAIWNHTIWKRALPLHVAHPHAPAHLIQFDSLALHC